MSTRAIGTGSISFGLVAIPVKLYPATQSTAAVSFNMLHKDCGSRLKQQYLCAREGVVVPREQMVKGYEFAKDEYVVFTPSELKSLEERASPSIDIVEFVPMDRIDPVYFEKPYLLAPEKGGEKAYHLLAEVMKNKGRCALARWAARGKQYLVMIRPTDKGLVMQQLLYADEVRSWADVPMPDVPPVREAEVRLAEQLVEHISVNTFEPGKFEDDVKKRVLADINRKIEGHQISTTEDEGAPAQIIDLMEALKASLQASEQARHPAKRSPALDEAPPAEVATAKPRSRKRQAG